jgi:glycosyltransferase involved in cell wall biosynthesis
VRLALAHDALVNRGGAERVAAVLCEAFPDAPLYTSVYLPGRTFPAFRSVDVRPSALQGLVRSERTLKTLFPLALWAMRRQLLKGFDVVLSSSTYAGKFVRVAPGTVHVCYCYTPFRLAWDSDSYNRGHRGALVRLGVRAAGALIRPWDRRAAARVDHFVTMTETTRARIRRAYGSDSLVIPPPIDCSCYSPGGQRSNRFLIVSRLEPYKRVDVLVEAFNRLGEPLCIVGAGSQRARLRALAQPNIEFRVDVPDDELRRLYATARALIMPQEEDYGLVALEALASGTPVIAYGVGGVRDTMIPAKRPEEAPHSTALFFAEQTADAVVAAIHAFADYRFRSDFLRAHAERFDKGAFITRMRSLIESVCGATGRDRPPGRSNDPGAPPGQ